MNKYKIFVWMPCWTWYPHPDTILNIFNQKLSKEYKIVFNMSWVPQRMPIHIARNKILEEFVRSWCDYLWFVDDDNPPMLDVLQKLLDSKKDIVSAIVPLRMYDKEWQSLNIFYNDHTWYIKNYDRIPKIDNPLKEIANCWTWCVLLSKRACFDIYKKYWKRAFWFSTRDVVFNKDMDIVETYVDQDKYDWYDKIYICNNDMTINKQTVDVSEDINFFDRLKDLWYKIYCRFDAECYHYNWMPSKRIIKEHFINK